ncbi:hypothetical protein ACFPVS_02655 [Neisseria weixii]|uniref:hypothetical protein n=1 Tax=Neisseria weixii TaxID=1853276 RepID=UPI00361869B0
MSDPVFFTGIIDEFENLYEQAVPNIDGLDVQAFKQKLFTKMLADDTSRFPMGFVYMDSQTHWDFLRWMEEHHPEQKYLA